MAANLYEYGQAGSGSNDFGGTFSAKDQARQHVGNNYNNYYNYTPRKRRSDESLRKHGRNEALLKAAAEGQASRVSYLLDLHVDLDHCDDEGYTALHHAVLSGFEDVVEILLKEGADVNASTLDNGTPLQLAATKARSNVVGLLLKYRANVTTVSQYVGSPLHCASRSGSVEIATELLNAGADVAQSCNVEDVSGTSTAPSKTLIHCTPIFLATRYGQADVVKLLSNGSEGSVDAVAKPGLEILTAEYVTAAYTSTLSSTGRMVVKSFSEKRRYMVVTSDDIYLFISQQDSEAEMAKWSELCAAHIRIHDIEEVLREKSSLALTVRKKGVVSGWWQFSGGTTWAAEQICTNARSRGMSVIKMP